MQNPSVNLLQNAERACEENTPRLPESQVIRVVRRDGSVSVEVEDNAASAFRRKILRGSFYTDLLTRKTGTGFGLHSGALWRENKWAALCWPRALGPVRGAPVHAGVTLKPELNPSANATHLDSKRSAALLNSRGLAPE